MPDETQIVETAESADAGTVAQNSNTDEAQAETPNPNPDAPAEQAKTYSQKELQAIVARESRKATEKALKELQDKAAEADMTEAQKATARADKAESELKAERRERLLDQTAAKHKLPDALRDRLRGDTAEELDADAAELAKLLPTAKREAPPSEGSRNGGNNALADDAYMTAIGKKMGF